MYNCWCLCSAPKNIRSPDFFKTFLLQITMSSDFYPLPLLYYIIVYSLIFIPNQKIHCLLVFILSSCFRKYHVSWILPSNAGQKIVCSLIFILNSYFKKYHVFWFFHSVPAPKYIMSPDFHKMLLLQIKICLDFYPELVL